MSDPRLLANEPAPARLPTEARIGAADLNVRDIERALRFYRDLLGFRVHRRDGDVVEIGADSVLLRLHATPEAQPRARGQAGLFHIAYLVPTRADLGRVIRHLSAARYPLQGASDHLVSEALYLADPEGNGIEIYRDRPRPEWPTAADGSLLMATEPMDVAGVLSAGEGPWTGVPQGTRIGHMHLNANDVAAAERFYQDVVGFDLMARYGSQASFLSAGGYHHHLGINSWGIRNDAPARADALGLRSFEIAVPKASYDAVSERFADGEGADPSGNRFRFRPA